MKQNNFKIYKLFLIVLLISFNKNYASDAGQLDPSFDNPPNSPMPGTIVTSIPIAGAINNASLAQAVTTQTINNQLKIIAIGVGSYFTTFSFTSINIARYNQDGSLDPLFNATGFLPGTNTANITSTSSDVGTDVVIQADNKIVVAANAQTVAGNIIYAARFNADGANAGLLDTTFNGTGFGETFLSTNVNTISSGIALAPDQKILVIGCDGTNLIILRYIGGNGPTAGTLDPTFGIAGIVSIAPNSNFQTLFGSDIFVQLDGTILICGEASVPTGSTPTQIILGKFDSSGNPVAGFGGVDGIKYTGVQIPDFVSTGVPLPKMAIQSDGKFVVCATETAAFLTARFNNADGSLDTTFNSPNGFVITSIGSPIVTAEATDITIECDGKILVTGTIIHPSNFALVKYTKNGTLDSTFNPPGNPNQPGVVTTNFAFANPAGSNAITLQPDNKIVLAGRIQIGAQGEFCLARYLNDVAINIITSPTQNQVIQTSTPTIAGTSSAFAGSMVNVTVNFLGGPQVFSGTTTVGSNGTWSITTTELEEDTTYTATATDACGSASVNFTLEQAPFVAITSPKNNSIVNTTRPLIQGTTKVGDIVKVSFNGGTPNSVSVKANRTWQIIPPFDLPQGKNTVTATATDPVSGQTASASITIFVQLGSCNNLDDELTRLIRKKYGL